MRILVTGGAGFLGSALTRTLRITMPEAHVTVADDMSTGRLESVAGWADDVVECAVWTAPHSEQLWPYDLIYHMASPASPDQFRDWWRDIVRANVHGTMRCGELLARGGVLIVASSSEVYGRTSQPMSESNLGSVRSCGVRGVYDEGKRTAEAIAWQIAQDRPDVGVCAARIFNTYGRGMPDDGRVVNTFVRRAKRGEPLVVHGDGSQTRTFCYVDDTVEMLLRLAVATRELGGFDVVNVGGGETVAIRDLASLVQRFAEVPVVSSQAREDDPLWRAPILQKLERKIGQLPKFTSLEEGVARCF